MKMAVLAGLCLALVGCAERDTVVLPQVASISNMTASWENPFGLEPAFVDITISPQDYGKVLALFDGRKRDKEPATWVVLGQVTIECQSSPKLEIGLFLTGEGPGAFSINGTYYRGSTDKTIVAVLNDCYKAVKDQR